MGQLHSTCTSPHLAELAHAVGAEGDQPGAARVGAQTLHAVVLRGVRPQHVHQDDAACV
jgi:hypothetical protein